jgi:epoxyqueuosine reductase
MVVFMASSETDILSRNIVQTLERGGAALSGFADVEGLTGPNLPPFTRAVSFALAMDPYIMAGLKYGPTREYSKLYEEMNQKINQLGEEVEDLILSAGFDAWAVPASVRSDPENIRGDFPHKTAATRAGLGWVGRHCQLVTHELGPWLRLGTVLTGAPLPPAQPVEKSFCGKCRACIDACPANALKGGVWSPGIERAEILNAPVCDDYKKAHFFAFQGGHNCGICTSACPYGHKLLKEN